MSVRDAPTAIRMPISRVRSVTAIIAEMATNGSTNGVSGCQKRPPSGVYG